MHTEVTMRASAAVSDRNVRTALSSIQSAVPRPPGTNSTSSAPGQLSNV